MSAARCGIKVFLAVHFECEDKKQCVIHIALYFIINTFITSFGVALRIHMKLIQQDTNEDVINT